MTYAGLVAHLAAMSVTGIAATQRRSSPPAIDTSGNYPLSYPRLPAVNRDLLTVGPQAGLDTATVEYVIVIARDTLDVASVRFSDTLAMIDNLNAALNTEMIAHNEIVGWTIQPQITEYGWSLVATVEPTG